MTASSPLISQATSQPQPNTPLYGAQALQVFQPFTRESFLAKFGVHAPVYDPTKKNKSWFDSDAPGKADASGNVTYKVLSALQPNLNIPSWDILTMSAAEAASVNIFGVDSYPAPDIQQSGVTAGSSTIDVSFLCTQAQALSIANLVGGTGLTEEVGNAFFPYVKASWETRGVWYFSFKGQQVYAGKLYTAMNAAGVGAPGHFDVSGATPVWVSDQPTQVGSVQPNAVTWQIPERDLLPNEKLVADNISWMIQRTDLQNPQVPSAVASGGGLTSDQDAKLSATAVGMQKILAYLKLS